MTKTLRITLLSIAAFVAALALFVVIGFWPGSTKGIEEVANRFEPGVEWRLESERIDPPQIICFKACPQLIRVWKLPDVMKADHFYRLVENAGWGDFIDKDKNCRTRDITRCSIDIYDDGFNVTIYAEDTGEKSAKVSMFIRKRVE